MKLADELGGGLYGAEKSGGLEELIMARRAYVWYVEYGSSCCSKAEEAFDQDSVACEPATPLLFSNAWTSPLFGDEIYDRPYAYQSIHDLTH
jgi:hypothetical protein